MGRAPETTTALEGGAKVRPHDMRRQLALECNGDATQGPYNTPSHGLKSDLPLWYALAKGRIIRSECPGKPSCNVADGGGAADGLRVRRAGVCARHGNAIPATTSPKPETIARTTHIRRLLGRRVYSDVYMNAYASAVIHSSTPTCHLAPLGWAQRDEP